jgi:hypothetical protein
MVDPTEALLQIQDKQIAELQAWRRSSMEVMNEIDLQAIAKELNMPLGVSIGPRILPGIKALRARVEELETLLSRFDYTPPDLYIAQANRIAELENELVILSSHR